MLPVNNSATSVDMESKCLEDWVEAIGDAFDSFRSEKYLLRLHSTATKVLPMERYRKSDVYGHLWICYARILARCVYEFFKSDYACE